ncbi:MAG TPA: glycosyltransferase [Ignavibacteria bacterium]
MRNPLLIVIGSLSYPKGSAPTNRIHLYCRALQAVNVSSLIISLDAPFIGEQQFKYVGRFEGIPYCFSRRTYIRKENFFARNTERLLGFINALFIISKHKKQNKNIVVLFFSALPIDELMLFLYLKLSKIKIIKECNEAPDFIIKEKRLVRVHNFFLKNVKLKRYDGIIVISNFLWEYYSKLYAVKRMFQIPILVDLNRFKVSQDKVHDSNMVITYIGFIGGKKDGLDDLIESIAIVSRSFSKLTLNLVGSGYKGDLESFIEKVNGLNLSEIIHILGNKDSSEIPIILANSDFLILTRPDNNQAKAGFPTKLGEYLASKKPVIITKTGEVTNYLEDNRSAYLVEPGNINGIAEKILFAINDKQAEKIGLEGFRIAEQYFDYKLYSNVLFNVLKRVLNLTDS